MATEAAQAIVDGQVGLFDDAGRSIEARFATFDTENPIVYELLLELALVRRKAGHDHYGIGAIFEDLRFEMRQRWGSDRGFKVNNDYRSRYARKLMREEPLLEGFFEVRALRSA